jgi:serine O-acetyltransferase
MYRAQMRDVLDDVRRTYECSRGTKLSRVVDCVRTPGLHAVAVYRFGRLAKAAPVVLRVWLDPIYAVLNLLIKIVWGIDLPRAATIGGGLYIGHFGGVTISPRAVIGRNCNLSHDVTIGASGRGNKGGVPIIGDDVYIAPGAKVFGKIKIGNNVKIGANTVVYRDVPDNAVIALAPGFQIISMNGNRPTRLKLAA